MNIAFLIKLIIPFCINYTDVEYCKNTVIDCYYDDSFTVEQCINEVKEEMSYYEN